MSSYAYSDSCPRRELVKRTDCKLLNLPEATEGGLRTDLFYATYPLLLGDDMRMSPLTERTQ
jgi:hypothetical protein